MGYAYERLQGGMGGLPRRRLQYFLLAGGLIALITFICYQVPASSDYDFYTRKNQTQNGPVAAEDLLKLQESPLQINDVCLPFFFQLVLRNFEVLTFR
jgi:hypothetical protein